MKINDLLKLNDAIMAAKAKPEGLFNFSLPFKLHYAIDRTTEAIATETKRVVSVLQKLKPAHFKGEGIPYTPDVVEVLNSESEFQPYRSTVEINEDELTLNAVEYQIYNLVKKLPEEEKEPEKKADKDEK